VNADEIVARIETDKVTVDIRSPRAGVIDKYLSNIEDTVQVNADFYIIDPDAKPTASASTPKPAESKPAPEPTK